MIEVRDACFSFDGEKNVLDRVSLCLRAGECVVLRGSNGSGKSTLARLLNGSLVPTSGAVLVDGQGEGLAQLVGYVRQDPRNQIVSAIVSDEVAFGPRNLGLPREEVLKRVGEALEACGISALRDRMTSELSGGEQQLVALAGVLAMRPRYLVLDEATAMLDRQTRGRVARIAEAAAASGVGVLEISHRPVLVADRVLTMGSGRFSEADEPPAQSAPPVRPRATSMTSTLRGEHLTVAYGEKPVLRDLSLNLRGLTLLTGASGAGKTTLARVLAGVLAPDAGEVTLDGRPVRAGDVGLAFQRPEDQLFCESVRDELAFAPRNMGADEPEVARRIEHAARMVGLDEVLFDRYPFDLSGGQARRVAIASVLALDAAAYLFDEPTAGLDAAGRSQMHALARACADDGRAVIVISHDLEEWMAEVDRVALLSDGRIAWMGTPGELSRDRGAFEAASMEPPLNIALARLLEDALRGGAR